MRTNHEIIEFMKSIMSAKNLSISEVARRVGMAKSAVSRYLNENREFPLNRADSFASALGTTSEELLGLYDADIVPIYNKLDTQRKQKVFDFANQQLTEQNNVVAFPVSNKTQVSVYGAVSAGNGEYLLDGQPELVDYEGTVPEHDFAVIVNGDSMEPLFEDRQIIFVRKTSDARHGQIVIADVDGEAFVKKLSIDTDETRLVSLNPRYKDIVIKDQNDFSIFGVVQL